jgi:hypothetical protein
MQLNLLEQSVGETNRVRPKSTSAIASHFSLAINMFRQSKPFHSGYNRLPRVHAITAVSTKPTSSIPSYSGQTKTYVLPFQDIPVMPKTTSSIPSQSSKAKIEI